MSPTAAVASNGIFNAPRSVKSAVAARLDTVEDWVTGIQAVTVSNEHWLNRLWPVIYAAAGIAATLLAVHANDLLKAMSAAK